MNLPLVSDRERVHRTLVLDDRAAYGELVRKYQAQIRAYLLRQTRQRESADDLAQETFLHGYRQLRQLSDGDRFRPWIYSVAHTQFLQWLRRQKDAVDAWSATEGESSETASTLRIGARAEVDSLLKSLRPEERSALILCLAHEFTHAEAAEILSLPLGTLKSLVLRAQTKIREQLGVTHE